MLLSIGILCLLDHSTLVLFSDPKYLVTLLLYIALRVIHSLDYEMHILTNSEAVGIIFIPIKVFLSQIVINI